MRQIWFSPVDGGFYDVLVDASVPFGAAGVFRGGQNEGDWVWFLDDRMGSAALGGFYYCELTPPRDHIEYFMYTSWHDETEDPTEVVDGEVAWLSADESGPVVALMPIESARLERLTTEGRFDELVTLAALDTVAAAWMRYRHLDPSDERIPDWWAVQLWMDTEWWSQEQRVRNGILSLVAAAATEDDLGAIGAGPMEVFIRDDEDRLAWLDQQAAASAPFRRALTNVYVWGVESNTVAARVERAARVRLARPRGWVSS